MMLAGLIVQVRPFGLEEEVNDMVPVKPFTGATVTVDCATSPARASTLTGLAVTVKSVILTVIVVVRDNDPLDPVTTTEYEPTEPEQESVEV